MQESNVRTVNISLKWRHCTKDKKPDPMPNLFVSARYQVPVLCDTGWSCASLSPSLERRARVVKQYAAPASTIAPRLRKIYYSIPTEVMPRNRSTREIAPTPRGVCGQSRRTREGGRRRRESWRTGVGFCGVAGLDKSPQPNRRQTTTTRKKATGITAIRGQKQRQQDRKADSAGMMDTHPPRARFYSTAQSMLSC